MVRLALMSRRACDREANKQPGAVAPPAMAVANQKTGSPPNPTHMATALANFTSPPPRPPRRQNVYSAAMVAAPAARPDSSARAPPSWKAAPSPARAAAPLNRFGIRRTRRSHTTAATSIAAKGTRCGAGLFKLFAGCEDDAHQD